MKKIALIGTGAIGGVLAQHLASLRNIEIFLYDVAPGRAYGKVLDIGHAFSARKSTYMAPVYSSEDITQIKGADFIIITAGFMRSAHMTRQDLLYKNIDVFKQIAPIIQVYAPNSMVLVVTNPVDTMTWFFQHITGYPKKQVFGMAGSLDEARFRYYVAKHLGVQFAAVETKVIGVHNDKMLPLPNYTTVNGAPLSDYMNPLDVANMIKETKQAGTKITELYQTQSPYFGAAAAIFQIFSNFLQNEKTLVTLSAPYKDEDIYIGQSCWVDATGICQIDELQLTKTEQKIFDQSITELSALNKEVLSNRQ